jgi:predicted N-acetyltransferase YhbS
MTLAEREVFFEMMERCFGLSKARLLKEAALNNQREFFVPENVFVTENHAAIDSMVRLTELAYQAGESEFTIGGIGAVATLPEARGRGRMGTLLDFAVEQMKQREIPLAILWGETRRYRNYGWEMAGNNLIFTLTAKSLKALAPDPNLKMESYRREKHLDSIMAMHRNGLYRTQRSKAHYAFLYDRSSLMVWTGRVDSEQAYLVLSGNAILEFGGEEDVLLQMVARLFRNFSFPELRLYCPQTAGDMIRRLYSVSEIWHCEPLGMLKIIDLPGLLESFKPQLRMNLLENPGLKGESVTLEMTDSQQCVTIAWGDQIELLAGRNSARSICLPDIEMVRLLFPFLHCPQNKLEATFAPLLKLPFFWNQLDMV